MDYRHWTSNHLHDIALTNTALKKEDIEKLARPTVEQVTYED